MGSAPGRKPRANRHRGNHERNSIPGKRKCISRAVTRNDTREYSIPFGPNERLDQKGNGMAERNDSRKGRKGNAPTIPGMEIRGGEILAVVIGKRKA